MKFPHMSVVIFLSSIEATLSVETATASNPRDGQAETPYLPVFNNVLNNIKAVIVEEISASPTQSPTNSPTETPTTANPTSSPTSVPTETPTSTPTYTPTSTPTYVPTKVPTEVPTDAPTETPTAAPTVLRKDECRVRMYYEKKFCWHDDARNNKCKETYKYCVAKAGDGLEMQKCGDTGGQKWVVIGHTVRPEKDKKLCWTMRGDEGIKLEKCGGKNQRFEGVCMNKKQIHPFGKKELCLTSGHEPRRDERCRFLKCDELQRRKTDRWEEG